MKFYSMFTAAALFTMFGGTVKAQNDTLENVDLNEIKVLSTRVPLSQKQTPQQVTVLNREEILSMPVSSVEDLLKYAAKVDVRQRGSGVQSDISLRGGTFDQVTVLLNGVNITSPHTGHLSADFPISKDDIKRIEILDGPSARVFSTQSFCGTINIVTLDDDPDESGYKTGVKGSVNAFAGDHGHFGVNANTAISHNAGYDTFGNPNRLIHNLSLGYVSDDGDTENSAYSIKRAFYRGSYRSKEVKADIQAGYSYKPFEANTFYGAASKDQWESNEHFLISASAELTAGNVHINPVFAADRRYDHYQWHKNSHAGENFHLCQVRTAGLNLWTKNRLGRTSLGFEMRSEQIYSTKLGEELSEEKYRKTRGTDSESDIFYTHLGDRTNITITGEHDFLFDKFTVALAFPAVYNTFLDGKWRWCPGLDASYVPTKNWKFFLNVNSALRMPTFTDLYYSGANIQGTSDLKPERTVDYGAGVKFRQVGFNYELRFFGSEKRDMIDWVIYADEPDQKTYRSGNFKVQTLGGEFDFAFLPQELLENFFVKRLDFQYSYINSDIEYLKAITASKYAQEYLKHKIALSGLFQIIKPLSFNVSYRYQYRTGKGNDPYALLDCGLKFSQKRFDIYAEMTNVLDKNYTDFSFIEQSGRRFVIGMKINF
ncbi:MAG: TonB-dependent receptor [Bacteroidales bacterium]|nr:TonB-dependent receptor [Bacteroidales bacterium]